MGSRIKVSTAAPYVGSPGGGGGSGTPNVPIAGTDASGNPIASPVLGGDSGNQNVTQVGGNTNTGFRSAVFGASHVNTGDQTLVGGSNHQVDGDKNIVGGYANLVPGDSNLIVGDSQKVYSDRNIVGGFQNTTDNQGGANGIFGTVNNLTDVNQSVISGNQGVFSRVYQSIVTGLSNTIKNVEDSIIVGASLVVGTLPGIVTKFCAVFGQTQNVSGTNHLVSGSGHTVTGQGNVVSGNGNVVSATNSRVAGTSHTVPGTVADVSGEGNIAHFGQIVKGRFAVENAVSDTVPTAGQMVEIVGWGTSDATRNNIRTLDDSGNEYLAGKLSFKSAKGIVGVIDGTSKNAGIVGEVLSGNASNVGLLDSVSKTILSVTLSAGIWDLFGSLYYDCVLATMRPNIGVSFYGWSLVDNTLVLATSPYAIAVTVPVATSLNFKYGGGSVNAGPINIAAPTTFYFVASASFSAGTVAAYAAYVARRIG